jgi:hypothetical protein
MRKTKSAVRNGETKGRDLQVKRFSYLPAGFCVPDPPRLVRRDGNHARAVPAKARRVNAALVAQRFAHRLAGVRIPDPCCIVSRQGTISAPPALKLAASTAASWSNGSPTGWPFFTSQILAVLSADPLAGALIPDPHHIVNRCGDNACAVRAEARRMNCGLEAQWFAHRLASVHVPDARAVRA